MRCSARLPHELLAVNLYSSVLLLPGSLRWSTAVGLTQSAPGDVSTVCAVDGTVYGYCNSVATSVGVCAWDGVSGALLWSYAVLGSNQDLLSLVVTGDGAVAAVLYSGWYALGDV